MALKLPLVLGPDGLPQQLQSSDTISVPTNAPSLNTSTSGESSAAMPFGTPVYISAADTIKRGQANAKTTAGITGLVYDPSIAAGASGVWADAGYLTGTTAQWDAVTGQTGGLTFNSLYYLDPSTPGKLTTTVPTTVGQVLTLVGRAISSTEFNLLLRDPILL